MFTTEYRDGEIQVCDTFTLREAPDFVVPRCFAAELDDPEYPCLVTLFVRMRSGKRPHVNVELAQRVDRTEELLTFDDLWLGGDAPLEPLGSIPELPLSRLTAMRWQPRRCPASGHSCERCGHIARASDAFCQ